MKKRLSIMFALLTSLMVVLAGCGNSGSADGKPEKVVIGYFPNINHAAAMVAKDKGFYEEALGDDIEVEFRTFPDGAAFMTALKAGELNGGMVGPGPAMNHYMNGAEVKVIAAGSTGGTVIVARDGSGIESVEDIKGKTFVSPRVGCTHDVQFETYMKELGITSQRTGGTMKHQTGAPAQYVNLFQSGQVDVATAPEPWASFLEEKVGAKPIIDSDKISFGETLPAAVYATNNNMAENNPELTEKLMEAHKKSTDYINENPEESQEIVVNSIKEITGQELSESVVKKAWDRINFTYEINEEALQEFANSSHDLGFLTEKPDLSGLIDKSFID
ncbi:aliphatic sulfonate ABC transporter substrate-binding protein [Bacillus tianshenii]|nr:aliphatic sulfonate ABC transporter substrate-binding protein [Bacillus tianshenii]